MVAVDKSMAWLGGGEQTQQHVELMGIERWRKIRWVSEMSVGEKRAQNRGLGCEKYVGT